MGSIISGLGESIVGGASDLLATLLAKGIELTIGFMIFVMLFWFIIIIIVNVVCFLYLLSIIALVINVPALLSNSNEKHALNIGPNVNDLINGNDKGAITQMLDSDLGLSVFNSVFGWTILILGGFTAAVIICLLGYGYAYNVARALAPKLFISNKPLKVTQTGYNSALGILGIVGRGIFTIVVTFLLLGFFYVILSVAVIGLAVIASLIMSGIMVQILQDMVSSGGVAAASISSSVSNIFSGSNATPTYYVPSILGNLTFNLNSSSQIQALSIPAYFFYEIMNFGGFAPTPLSGSNGLFITPISATYIKTIIELSPFGVGFILVPWYALVLAAIIYVTGKLGSFFWLALKRVFYLFLLFFGIIVAAVWALYDGGTKWKETLISTTKWFFLNTVYVVGLNIFGLVGFIIIWVGMVIASSFYNLTQNGNGLLGSLTGSNPLSMSTIAFTHASFATVSTNSIINSASGITTDLWKYIDKLLTFIFEAAPFGTQGFWADTLMLFFIMIALSVTNSLVAKRLITNDYIGKNDIASQFLGAGDLKSIFFAWTALFGGMIGLATTSRGIARFASKPVLSKPVKSLKMFGERHKENASVIRNMRHLKKANKGNQKWQANNGLITSKRGKVLGVKSNGKLTFFSQKDMKKAISSNGKLSGDFFNHYKLNGKLVTGSISKQGVLDSLSSKAQKDAFTNLANGGMTRGFNKEMRTNALQAAQGAVITDRLGRLSLNRTGWDTMKNINGGTLVKPMYQENVLAQNHSAIEFDTNGQIGLRHYDVEGNTNTLSALRNAIGPNTQSSFTPLNLNNLLNENASLDDMNTLFNKFLGNDITKHSSGRAIINQLSTYANNPTSALTIGDSVYRPSLSTNAMTRLVRNANYGVNYDNAVEKINQQVDSYYDKNARDAWRDIKDGLWTTFGSGIGWALLKNHFSKSSSSDLLGAYATADIFNKVGSYGVGRSNVFKSGFGSGSNPIFTDPNSKTPNFGPRGGNNAVKLSHIRNFLRTAASASTIGSAFSLGDKS